MRDADVFEGAVHDLCGAGACECAAADAVAELLFVGVFDRDEDYYFGLLVGSAHDEARHVSVGVVAALRRCELCGA